MRNGLIIVGLVLACAASAFGVEGEGYDATISEKTDIFMNKEKIGTIPESALFRAMKIRDDWVFGTYTDVDTDEMLTGWIEMERIADLDKMLKALKAESENYLLDGERRYQEKRYREAIDLLTESIDRHPKQPHALLLRAESHMFLGKTTEAGRDYSMIIEMAPESKEGTEAYLSRAKLYIDAGKYKNATKDLTHVLTSQPDNAEASLYMGDIRYAHGMMKEAIAYYNRGVQSDPNIGALFYKRGLAYFYLNMFDEARSDLTRALELNKENTGYQKALAYVNQHVRMLENITPAEVLKMLEIRAGHKDDKLMVSITNRRVLENITPAEALKMLENRAGHKDDKLMVSITNRSKRPLVNLEVAMAVFIEDTFEREVEERRDSPSRDFSRGRHSEESRITPLEIEVHEIRFLPGAARGSTANTKIIAGESFAQGISEEGKEYYGYMLIVFVNKQEVLLRAFPNSLKYDFEDTIVDMRVEVQAEKAR